MPVSSAFFVWREAEHASLQAQTAIHGAHLDHCIGQSPRPNREALEQACMLHMRAHELFLGLMSDMAATARALRQAASDCSRARP